MQTDKAKKRNLRKWMPGFSSVRAYVNEGKMELSIGFYLAKEVAFFVPITLINQSFFFSKAFSV